jgi:hypothetical protein
VARPIHSVDQQNILPAIGVEVEKGAAGTQSLGQQLASERAVVVVKLDSRGLGDVRKPEGWLWRRRLLLEERIECVRPR